METVTFSIRYLCFQTKRYRDEKVTPPVGGADGTARLWNVQTGQEVRRFTGHQDEVCNVIFSPDGKYILNASSDGTARLWLLDL